MSTIYVEDGATIEKDPRDSKVYAFDWDTYNLAPDALIASSAWTITAVEPSSTDDQLTKDSPSILSGSRQTQIRLIGGTLGQKYKLENEITTDETPVQIKNRKVFVLIQDR